MIANVQTEKFLILGAGSMGRQQLRCLQAPGITHSKFNYVMLAGNKRE